MLELYENYAWPYEQALAWMIQAHEDVVQQKRPPLIALGMHSHRVITLGLNTPESQILAHETIAKEGIAIHRIERGGGATAHEPGQLVLYPIVPLGYFGDKGVRIFSARLEDSVIALLKNLGVSASKKCSAPGVFIGEKKIAQLGFRVKSGVVLHGLAMNISNNLSTFSLIAPCGSFENNAVSLSEINSAEDWDISKLGVKLISHLVGREKLTSVIR